MNFLHPAFTSSWRAAQSQKTQCGATTFRIFVQSHHTNLTQIPAYKRPCYLFTTPKLKQAGFTLLEILLVIVILAVSTALVVPSFFSASMPSVNDEVRRLSLAMKLASDEAALGGYPFRWSARTGSYVFEKPDREGVWHAEVEKPFAEYALPSGISIVDVQPANTSLMEDAKPAKKGAKPVLARLLFSAQGVMAASEVVLADSKQRISILLRPGPGGIQISKP